MQRLRPLRNFARPIVRLASSSDWTNLCVGYDPAVLNRSSHLRKDDKWLNSNMTSTESDFILFMGKRPVGEHISESSIDLKLSRYSYSELEPYLTRDNNRPQCIFLGIDGTRPLFLVGFDKPEKALLDAKRDILSGFVSAQPLVNRRLLCYARSILTWNKSHLFCGACGSPTESAEGGHKRVCSNSGCSRHGSRSQGDNALSHPRTDPAVIVAITDGSRMFLARKESFPPSVLSCIAGFVEPGETLEDAVFREVFEETGLTVNSVRYIMSQPWPFDNVLKLGCLATVEPTALIIDKEELSFADWFSLNEVTDMLTHKHTEWSTSPPLLLSYQLVDYWAAEMKKKAND